MDMGLQKQNKSELLYIHNGTLKYIVYVGNE